MNWQTYQYSNNTRYVNYNLIIYYVNPFLSKLTIPKTLYKLYYKNNFFTRYKYILHDIQVKLCMLYLNYILKAIMQS